MEEIHQGPPRPRKGPPKSKAKLQDDSIMGTNNSSIVSKRSVERIYFPNEPQFFRHFVKKPQRRSPLINRGYWLRMKAIDNTARSFLEQPSEKRKVIINLGCGFDPLPWQCLSRYPSACQNVVFIDVDYRDLMVKKRSMVQDINELSSMFTNVEVSDGDILLRSDQYIQIGCDLRNLASFIESLAGSVDLEGCMVLFTAEVSITYMDVEAADSLIRWAGTLPEARFCLLEQLLPDGIHHPFAKTMMAHFEKLQTPLRAVEKYPTVEDQKYRFHELGWPNVSVRNLWDLWSSPDFASSAERTYLDSVEPFDEWEEFALFGSHYFLLVADTSCISDTHHNTHNVSLNASVAESPSTCLPLEVSYMEYPKMQGCRRFAATFTSVSKDLNRHRYRISNFGGMGPATRLNSYDEYTMEEVNQTNNIGDLQLPANAPSLVPSSRMCHTITDLGDIGALLVGGRTSPDNALADCWLYHKWLGIWERIDDLPYPLYRHQAVNLGHGCVLVSTGRLNSKNISQDYLIWSRRHGWVKSTFADSEVPPATYGAVFFATGPEPLETLPSVRNGIIGGGMTADAIMWQELWRWELKDFSGLYPLIIFRAFEGLRQRSMLARFGASVVKYQHHTYILGGVIKDQILKTSDGIWCLEEQGPNFVALQAVLNGLNRGLQPLLIGPTVAVSAEGQLLIMGGSAVCFSFGTFWNKGCFTMQRLTGGLENGHVKEVNAGCVTGRNAAWRYLHTVTASERLEDHRPSVPSNLIEERASKTPRLHLTDSANFERVLQSSRPVIFEGLNIGKCVTKWTTSYLKEHVGVEREIIVHEANTEHMNFKAKNFAYASRLFGDFIDQINNGDKLYLRSLAIEKPSTLPAEIGRDFPSIAADFQLPPELDFVSKNAHSSILRISGPVIMWLHYDVMANILCQIKGSKRLILYPPSDFKHFDFGAGESSSHTNVFVKLQDRSLAYTHPHEVLLEPGDVLFIPPLWLHTATPGVGVSVAVNVFFRNLQFGYAAGKDVYGNRDLQAYEKGRRDIAKVIKSFDGLPTDVRAFYLQRLMAEFKQNSS